MSYSHGIYSNFNNTSTRSKIRSSTSGMCSLCREDCVIPCEIALSAVLGAKTVYPTTTGNNQIASEKLYPFDYSHFNINGRVFGPKGASGNPDDLAIFKVNLEQTIGFDHKVKLATPIMLPALIKLNWKDYFAGAAMAGTLCVIGEGAPSKDPSLKIEKGKIADFPFLKEIASSFKDYDRGYGQIVLQCNYDDDAQGLPEYALRQGDIEAIEFKFGQGAKGTQPVNTIKDYESALALHQAGVLVHPNPLDENIRTAHEQGNTPNFYQHARFPAWDEDFFAQRIPRLREMGMKNTYFKMAGFDPVDIERVLRIAAQNKVDMVTFDGAGGGSGYSPSKMMDEWGLPTIQLEATVYALAQKLRKEGLDLPAIAITGGFSSEDQIYKALALGETHIRVVGVGRAAMAAATNAKNIGTLIQEGKVPAHLEKYGSTLEEIFADLPDLRYLYGKKAREFSPGAIGVYSYLNRLHFGLQHFAALNRKYHLSQISREDLIPLTSEARGLIL